MLDPGSRLAATTAAPIATRTRSPTMPTKTAPTKATAPQKAPSKTPTKGSAKAPAPQAASSSGSKAAKATSGASTKAAASASAHAPHASDAPILVTASQASEPIEPETQDASVESVAVTTPTVDLSPAVIALLADPAAPNLVGQQCEALVDSRQQIASQAANVIAQVFATRPELVVPHVSKLAKAIVTKNKRVVQVCADAMPSIAKVAPARVARELDFLRAGFGGSLEEGQDGLVRTFATLCIASVAYQKRLEPVLTEALSIAEGKTLLRWTQAILPSLKGEPHARARAVVEGRLEALPRPVAQPIADFLGIKLRPRPR